MSLWSRFLNVFRSRVNDDIDAELQSHFEEAKIHGRDLLETSRAPFDGLTDKTRNELSACFAVHHTVQKAKQAITRTGSNRRSTPDWLFS